MNIIHGDCLEEMPKLDLQVDMILCDLPYGTTACKWDTIIPFEPLWEQYKRLIKPNGAIVLFGSQPFTSALVMSNPKWFKYEWVWEKTNSGDFMLAKIRPRIMHESVSVFYKNQPVYNPQMEQGIPYLDKPRKRTNRITDSDIPKLGISNPGTRYPSSVQMFSNGNNNIEHPTQKPVALCEYLIRTYTNEGDLVLDNCAGSGTTGVACLNTNREFILIEKEKEYYDIILKRLKETPPRLL